MGVGRIREEAKEGEWIEVIRRESKGEVGADRGLAFLIRRFGVVRKGAGDGRGRGRVRDGEVGGGDEDGGGDGVKETEEEDKAEDGTGD